MSEQQTEATETAPEANETPTPGADAQTGSEVTEGTVPAQDEGTEGNAPADDAGQEGDDGQGEGDDRQAKDAAKYRRKLRATERERDQAQEQLTAARRQLAESASGLTHPAGLWAAGTEVDDLFGEDGQLNREALATATQEAVAKLGLRMGGRPPRPNPAQDGPGGLPRKVTMEQVVTGQVR